MEQKQRSSFTIRPHGTPGVWASDHRRHAESAEHLLQELETVCIQEIEQWPLPAGKAVRNAKSDYPELYALNRKRDRLSDSVTIFAAFAVEGFLNFYGVVRLGESVFNEHFERLGLVSKLRLLLLICDSISVSKEDPLVRTLVQLANGRNSLSHPKSKEYSPLLPAEERPSVLIPKAARDAVTNMKSFFAQFVALVPEAMNLVPPDVNE